MGQLCIFGVIFFTFVLLTESQDPTINGKLGEVVGNIKTIPLEGLPYQTVHEYLGIPFALPPVGDRRFRKPEPMTSLSSPFYAQNHGAFCPQVAYPEVPIDQQSEDCLYLNVYVPERPADQTSGHAVMVWIYGGGFQQGSASLYDFSTLSIAGNIIVVTINYRIGVFGFLSTGDDNSRGNFGLWDQKMALQWVHDNIGDFGGDNQRVTICGESAGAMSVIQQALTPSNFGVFQRAIAQSGSMSNPTTVLEKDGLKDVLALAKEVECESDLNEALMNCLREKSFEELLSTIKRLGRSVDFSPRVDGDFIKINPQHIAKMSESEDLDEVDFFRSIDILSGFNGNEGAFILPYFMDPTKIENLYPTPEEYRNEYLPSFMINLLRTRHAVELLQAVEAQYTNWSNPYDPQSIRLQMVNLPGDITFCVPAVQMARLHDVLSSSRNFMYHFAPKPSIQAYPSPSWVPGANHADDLTFILGAFGYLGIGEENAWENELIIKMMTYWSNFVKSGDPNTPEPISPSWPEYSMATGDYLVLDKSMSESSAKQHFYAEKANFWLKVFPDLVDAVNEHDEGSCENGSITSAAGNFHVFSRVALIFAVLSASVFLF